MQQAFGRAAVVILRQLNNEALSPVGFLFEKLPIADPSDEARAAVEAAVTVAA